MAGAVLRAGYAPVKRKDTDTNIWVIEVLSKEFTHTKTPRITNKGYNCKLKMPFNILRNMIWVGEEVKKKTNKQKPRSNMSWENFQCQGWITDFNYKAIKLLEKIR